jgi:Tfp pilus assembly protein PilP
MSMEMTKTLRLFLLLIAVMIAGSAVWAQSEDDPEAATEPTRQEEGVLEELEGILDEPIDSFRYDPQGRRDPFRSLIGPAQQSLDRGDAPPGVPGFLIDELDLQGIVRTARGYIATVRGPDNKGYTLRPGDRLYDGEVLRITSDAVHFRQEVNDPTRIERQREVVKQLERGSQTRRR